SNTSMPCCSAKARRRSRRRSLRFMLNPITMTTKSSPKMTNSPTGEALPNSSPRGPVLGVGPWAITVVVYAAPAFTRSAADRAGVERAANMSSIPFGGGQAVCEYWAKNSLVEILLLGAHRHLWRLALAELIGAVHRRKARGEFPLWQCSGYPGLRYFELFRGPRLALHTHVHTEERTVRVDLGGMRRQRGIAAFEPIRGVHAGGDARVDVLLRAPEGQLGHRALVLTQGHLTVGLPLCHRLGEHVETGHHESVCVIQLQGSPGLAKIGSILGVSCQVPGAHGHRVDHQVIRVRVTTVFVIGNDHVRLEFADLRNHVTGHLVDILQCKAAV